MPLDLIGAHAQSSKHRRTILAGERCGCSYCIAIFAPSEITDWVDENTTALCPKCGIDSVIGSASGFPIDRDFLKAMHLYWFS